MDAKDSKLESTLEPEQPSLQPEENAMCLLIPGKRLREGMICPRCHQAKIEYDGLLNLVCPKCGLTEVGAST